MSSSSLRVVEPGDVEGILEIYAPIVRETVISFELEPPNRMEMQDRIADTLLKYPWLVAEGDGRILAYAYASDHRDRWAYHWAANVSVYVHPAARRRGLARRLYAALLALLRAQGYYNVYAGIALPNEGSVGLHESMGFRRVALYMKVGFKLGEWRDVGWWELALGEHPAEPPPPRSFAGLAKAETDSCLG
ncbi:MAG: arsinothricin resistance N-acetyltransferase ArsN1 family B [Anaerolineales bacterium]